LRNLLDEWLARVFETRYNRQQVERGERLQTVQSAVNLFG